MRSVSFGGVFKGSELCQALKSDYAGLPPRECLPNDNRPIPYHLVEDDAFGLKS